MGSTSWMGLVYNKRNMHHSMKNSSYIFRFCGDLVDQSQIGLYNR